MYNAFMYIAKCLGFAAINMAIVAMFTGLTYKHVKPFFEWFERENTKEKGPVAGTNGALGKNQHIHYSK